jgi:hypothetical protein
MGRGDVKMSKRLRRFRAKISFAGSRGSGPSNSETWLKNAEIQEGRAMRCGVNVQRDEGVL